MTGRAARINEQVRNAERAIDGHASIKRNRYIQLSGVTKSVNGTLEAKTRALAGWKGSHQPHRPTRSRPRRRLYQLWRIEKAFRMSKSDRAP
jgi:hypothetical protein